MRHDSTPAVDWNRLYTELSRPFPDALIKYRVGAISRDQKKAQALPYVDPRVYEDRLNELAPGEWSVRFEPWGENRVICHLSIHGVTRSSTGDGSSSPQGIRGMAAESQALRRACSKFGLGRHLYELSPAWLPYDPQSKSFRATSASVERDDRQPADWRGPNKASRPDHLGRQRAATMQRELARLGLARSKHLSFACRVLGRNVTDFGRLSETDARQVWNVARAEASQRQ